MAKHIDFKLDSADYTELGTKALSHGEIEKAIGLFQDRMRTR